MARQAKQIADDARTGPNAGDARQFEVVTDTLGASPSYQKGDRINAYETPYDWQYLIENGSVRVVEDAERSAATATPADLGIPPAVLTAPAADAPLVVDAPPASPPADTPPTAPA